MRKLTIRQVLLASVGVSVLAITSATAADIVQVFGDQWHPRCHDVRDLLARHRVPYRWFDTGADDDEDERLHGAEHLVRERDAQRRTGVVGSALRALAVFAETRSNGRALPATSNTLEKAYFLRSSLSSIVPFS